MNGLIQRAKDAARYAWNFTPWGILGGAFDAIKNLINIPSFAQGVNNFGGGLAMVGERGPELALLPRGSSVVPNNQVDNIINRSTNSNQNINIYVEKISDKMDLDMIGRELGFRASMLPK
jgi:hypothetical protein